MALTYDRVAQSRVTSSTVSSVTLSSISGSYTDLMLVIAGKSAAIDDSSAIYTIALNSGTRVDWRSCVIDSTAVVSAANWVSVAPNTIPMNAASGSTYIYFSNYTNTNMYQLGMGLTGQKAPFSNENWTGMATSEWNTTTAISSITITAVDGNFTYGSTVTLYGILKA